MITKMAGNITWEGNAAREQHRRELLAAAGRQRLARSVSRSGMAFSRLWLARFGEQLIKWGYRLQFRYGTLTSSIDIIEMLGRQHDALPGRQYANSQA